MYRVIYIIFSVFILLRNNVESVSSTETTPSDTTTIISTNSSNSEDEEIVTSQNNVTTSAPNSTEELVTSTSLPIDDYWMTQMGEINDDLLNIQAIIVKDEDAEKTCTEGSQKS